MGRAGPRLASACSQQAHVVGLPFHKGRNPLVKEAWPGSQHGRPSRASGQTQTGGEKLRAKQEAWRHQPCRRDRTSPTKSLLWWPCCLQNNTDSPRGAGPCHPPGSGCPLNASGRLSCRWCRHMGRCQPGRCTLLRRGWGLGVTGTRGRESGEQDPLFAGEGPHGDSTRPGRPAIWFTSTVSVTQGRLAGFGAVKKAGRELPGPAGVLTSHVLHGAVKHEIEQWVEPLQDAAGL